MKNENLYNQILESWRVPDSPPKEESWEAIQRKIKEVESGTPVIPISKKPVSKIFVAVIAAAAAVLAGVLVFNMDDTVSYESPLASVKQITLPDGSTVALNAGSKLSYDKDLWKEERVLDLSGEAFFDVEEGSSFQVRTPQGDVTVLGTSFNVYSWNETFEVSCVTGKVSVEHEDLKSILTPGERTALSEGKLVQERFDGNPAGWANGEYFFDNASLNRVFNDLSLAYGVEILHPNWEDEHFEGRLTKSTLEESLSIVCTAFNLEFSIENNKVEIWPL